MTALPEFLRPRLRLFLSADIVGSTALKQSPRDKQAASAEWFVVIQGFYSEARRLFLGDWQALVAKGGDVALGPTPEFWKVIGDEIVFVKTLTNYREVATTIRCWCEAMQKLRQFVKSRAPRLDVKCTAWTAGFPIMNKEVVLEDFDPSNPPRDHFKETGDLLNAKYRDEKRPNMVVDYIGPAIDIGFRLAAHATPRKFVLSVGAAYILSMTTVQRSKNIQLRFDGAFPLKGVFGGADYPIFWIDMATSDDISGLEDKLLGRVTFDRDVVTQYCEKFFEDNSGYTFPPFIESAEETEIKAKPAWYDDALRVLAANYAVEELPDRKSEEAAELQGQAIEAEPRINSSEESENAAPSVAQAKGVLRADELEEIMKILGISDDKPKKPAGKK